ncbi:hypothetical protein ACWCXL_42680, partial [Streptomyces sp. NPDC001588]
LERVQTGRTDDRGDRAERTDRGGPHDHGEDADRLVLGAVTAALLAVVGVGAWLATSDADDGQPPATRNSAPASP